MRKHDNGDLFVQATLCPTDLLRWILHHWVGRLEVSYGNRFIFKELLTSPTSKLATREAKMTFMITGSCEGHVQTRCHSADHVGSVWIGHPHSTLMLPGDVIFETATDPLAGYQTGRVPCKVYDFVNPYTSLSLSLTDTETRAAKAASRAIIIRILNTAVTPSSGGVNLRVVEHEDDSSKPFRTWVSRIPAILQWDLPVDTAPHRIPPPSPVQGDYISDNSDLNDDIDQKNESDDLEASTQLDHLTGHSSESDGIPIAFDLDRLCVQYPELQSAIQLGRVRCKCGCNDRPGEPITAAQSVPRRASGKQRQSDEPIAAGCVQSAMFGEVMLNIGHALADAGGAESVSNLLGSESSRSLLEAAVNLLFSISDLGEITWGGWFRLVCSAHYGYLVGFSLGGGN